MRSQKIEYCKETKKYRYSSEAKANRAMNKYKDIRRVYYCNSCDGFHTTSMGIGLSIEHGVIEKPKKKKNISSRMIQDKINYLENVIKQKDEFERGI